MKRVVDYEEMFPNRFLKSGLFAVRPLTLTIKSVDTDELPSEDGGTKEKGIISFVQTDKQLSVNRTNAETIRCMFGRKAADWVGKRITFCSEVVKMKGKPVDSIRIFGSPDIPRGFTAEFDITKAIQDNRTGHTRIVVEHISRRLEVTDPSNRGELRFGDSLATIAPTTTQTGNDAGGYDEPVFDPDSAADEHDEEGGTQE